MHSLKKIAPLAIVLSVILGVNALQAAWTGPSGSAPNSNTEAPINTGGTLQTKSGDLGVTGSLSAGSAAIDGNSILNRDIQIGNDAAASPENSPTIKFEDSDHQDWWMHINSNRIYFIADRDDNGNWSGENPWPLQLYAGATAASDFALFSNEIRAVEYCDEGGANCFDSADVSGSGINFITPVTIFSGAGGSVQTAGWATFDATPHIPSTANGVIVQSDYAIAGPDSGDVNAHVYIGDTPTPNYLLLKGRCSGSNDGCGNAAQGFFPVSSSLQIYYNIESPGFGNITLSLIGYF